MAVVQDTHRLAITTPLGENVLLLRGFNGSEAISQLFHFDLELLSENTSISFQDVVGKNVTLRIDDAQGVERHWNGFISRFSQGSQDGRLTTYRAQMVPWLWFLTRTADCRIFQSQKVPDIIQKIFTDLKFRDFELRLYGTYQPRDYCVQYRETDFNFVSRLMEEEGICYFFDHQDGKHVMVLADDPAAHKPCPGQTTARCALQASGMTYTEDVVTDWHYFEEFRTGTWAQTDYNFETPSTSLAVTVNGNNPYEIYDYPGEHAVRSDGDRLARIRLQEHTAASKVNQGGSTCREFGSGFQFTLQDHYRKDLNQAYLLTSVRHTATVGGTYGVGTDSGDELSYRNTFECIPYSIPFRPARTTPQPFVQGCQTALVVGPGGEEIYTDKHGRVKVQFYWDREGKKNENSSCWIRVSHPWAGQGWGAVSIPRIGQEVIVDFLEGNPDQPIIVGRVYNAGQMPPFGMPGGAMISGIKSNSTKGGGGFNEISLNDTKGKELINIHAQHDQQKKVEHDERVDVLNDRTEHVYRDEKITIDRDRTEEVKHDEKIMIDHDRTEEVKHDERIKIGNDKSELVVRDRRLEVDRDKIESVLRNKEIDVGGQHNEKIGGSMEIFVGRTLTETVAINLAESVGGAMELTVGGLLAVTAGGAMAESVGGARAGAVGGSSSETVGGGKSLTVGGDLSETIAKNRTVRIQQDLKEKIGGQHSETVEKEYLLHAKKMQFVAEEVSIKVGDAQMVMKNGNITITGKKITIEGSGDVAVKGSKIKDN